MIYLVLKDTSSQETVLGHFSRMLRIHYQQVAAEELMEMLVVKKKT